MDEHDEEETESGRRPRAEGVRIIGADEAARALEQGQAEGRRPGDAPRYGDVPERPTGPAPAPRFPLPQEVDPADAVNRPPVAGPRHQPLPKGPPPGMPHWTEPPSGEVPTILGPGETGAGEDETWRGTSVRGPRWRDRDADWADADFDDVASFTGEETRLGALDVNRTEHSDLFSFDEPPPPPPVSRPQPAPAAPTTQAAAPTTTTPITTRQPRQSPPEPSGGRDMGAAIGVGVGLALVALALFKAGPKFVLALAVVVVTLGTVEVYDVFRRSGHRPATLLGIVATVSLMVAAYAEGETAVLLILALTTIFSFLWYLFGVVRARPTINVAVTMLGFLWVAVSGSFAALMLAYPERRGIAFLLGAVIGTVGYDVGALFFGSQIGHRPLAPEISPNKTVEGLVGGMVSCVVLTLLIVGAVPGIHPWTTGDALALGLMVAVVAPIGDLCQSMVKRDLGIKDMGTLIPGHGGVMDRFDSLLFVLPATYYLVRLLDLG